MSEENKPVVDDTIVDGSTETNHESEVTPVVTTEEEVTDPELPVVPDPEPVPEPEEEEEEPPVDPDPPVVPEPEPVPSPTIRDIDASTSEVEFVGDMYDLALPSPPIEVSITPKDSEGNALPSSVEDYEVLFNDKAEYCVITDAVVNDNQFTVKVGFAATTPLAEGKLTVRIKDTEVILGNHTVTVEDNVPEPTISDMSNANTIVELVSGEYDLNKPADVVVKVTARTESEVVVASEEGDFEILIDGSKVTTKSSSYDDESGARSYLFRLGDNATVGTKEITVRAVILDDVLEAKATLTVVNSYIPTIEDLDKAQSTVSANSSVIDFYKDNKVTLTITVKDKDGTLLPVTDSEFEVLVDGEPDLVTVNSRKGVSKGVIELEVSFIEGTEFGSKVLTISSNTNHVILDKSITLEIKQPTLTDLDSSQSSMVVDVNEMDVKEPKVVVVTFTPVTVDGRIIDSIAEDYEVVLKGTEEHVIQLVNDDTVITEGIVKTSLTGLAEYGVDDYKLSVRVKTSKAIVGQEVDLKVVDIVVIPEPTLKDVDIEKSSVGVDVLKVDVKTPQDVTVTFTPRNKDGEVIESVAGDFVIVLTGENEYEIELADNTALVEGTFTTVINDVSGYATDEYVITVRVKEGNHVVGEVSGFELVDEVDATEPTLADLDSAKSEMSVDLLRVDVKEPEDVTITFTPRTVEDEIIESTTSDFVIVLSGKEEHVIELNDNTTLTDGVFTTVLTGLEQYVTDTYSLFVRVIGTDAVVGEVVEFNLVDEVGPTEPPPSTPEPTVEDVVASKTLITTSLERYDRNNPLQLVVHINTYGEDDKEIVISSDDITLVGADFLTLNNTTVDPETKALILTYDFDKDVELGQYEYHYETNFNTTQLGSSQLLHVVETIDVPELTLEDMDASKTEVVVNPTKIDLAKDRKLTIVVTPRDEEGAVIQQEKDDFTIALGIRTNLHEEGTRTWTYNNGIHVITFNLVEDVSLGEYDLTVRSGVLGVNVGQSVVIDIEDSTPTPPEEVDEIPLIPLEPSKPKEDEDENPIIKDPSKLTNCLTLIKVLLNRDRKLMAEWIRDRFWDDELIALFESEGGVEADVEAFKNGGGLEQGIEGLFLDAFRSVAEKMENLDHREAWLVKRLHVEKWDYYFPVNRQKLMNRIKDKISSPVQRQRSADIGLALINFYLGMVFLGTEKGCPNVVTTVEDNNRVAIHVLYNKVE